MFIFEVLLVFVCSGASFYIGYRYSIDFNMVLDKKEEKYEQVIVKYM